MVLGRDLLNPYDGASYATPVFLLDFPAVVYGSRNLERVRELRGLSASAAPAWVEENGAIGLDPQQRDTFDRWVRANFLGRSLPAGRAELATSLRPLPKLVPWESTPLPEGRVGAVHVPVPASVLRWRAAAHPHGPHRLRFIVGPRGKLRKLSADSHSIVAIGSL